MNKPYDKPTEAELEILQILWKHGPSTVRFVNEELNKQREVGYTTTLKMMQVMNEKKGLLERDASKRTHIYRALISEEFTQKKLMDRLLETAFGGSAMKLVMQALGHKKTSQAELDEIKKMIQEMEKGGKS